MGCSSLSFTSSDRVLVVTEKPEPSLLPKPMIFVRVYGCLQVQSGETERWSAADGQAGRGCRVIVEDAPPPGASLGRLSFGAFNPTIEALQACSPPHRLAILIC